ncbi:MAG: hypothetical protein AAF628_37220 [Planctomycetota bacterium]
MQGPRPRHKPALWIVRLIVIGIAQLQQVRSWQKAIENEPAVPIRQRFLNRVKPGRSSMRWSGGVDKNGEPLHTLLVLIQQATTYRKSAILHVAVISSAVPAFPTLTSVAALRGQMSAALATIASFTTVAVQTPAVSAVATFSTVLAGYTINPFSAVPSLA